ncbi:MAG: ADP-ribosylglycohydrolase family protein, partial [Eubacteriales bacterium]|nr:ADP-ribosylglycohydrolase family protein [Eubacteriales bacterium]
MFGAIIGELAAFPYIFKQTDLTDREIPLLRMPADAGGAKAGRDFSAAAVMTAAVQDGLLRFRERLPAIAEAGRGGAPAGEEAGGAPGGSNISDRSLEAVFSEELAGAMRRFGRAMPFAGYPVDLSIWLNREDARPAETEDAGPAARVSPVAWMFQDDLYMMRHLAVLQAGITNRGRESARAADAAASAVFLALHGCTKDYIAEYMERQFGYRIPREDAMRQELLEAARPVPSAQDPGEESRRLLPSLYVRAGLTAFLHGRDFEDVLRRAVSLGGGNTETAAVAGSVAEAFFGIPEQLLEESRRRLPAEILRTADAFADVVNRRKKWREENPAARARWESALTRASSRHPAAVQGNEPLEQAIGEMCEKKDRQSFIAALRTLQARMSQKGRVFVPVVSVKRTQTAAGGVPAQAGKGTEDAVFCRMQAIRTRDGKLWQPAFTSRAQLDLARKQGGPGTEAGTEQSGMVLSYALEALLRRFLPEAQDIAGNAADAGKTAGPDSGALRQP